MGKNTCSGEIRYGAHQNRIVAEAVVELPSQ
jgi:hypothetical protein